VLAQEQSSRYSVFTSGQFLFSFNSHALLSNLNMGIFIHASVALLQTLHVHLGSLSMQIMQLCV